MSWLKKDLALLSRTAEEEFYEALAQAHERGALPGRSSSLEGGSMLLHHGQKHERLRTLGWMEGAAAFRRWHATANGSPHLLCAQAMAPGRRSKASGCTPARRAAPHMAWRSTGDAAKGRGPLNSLLR